MLQQGFVPQVAILQKQTTAILVPNRLQFLTQNLLWQIHHRLQYMCPLQHDLMTRANREPALAVSGAPPALLLLHLGCWQGMNDKNDQNPWERSLLQCGKYNLRSLSVNPHVIWLAEPKSFTILGNNTM